MLGALKKGEQITVTGFEGKWAKTTYNGKTAYVSSDYLKDVNGSTTTPKPEDNNSGTTEAKTMEVTANLNVRSGEGTNYSILGTLKKGTQIKVVSVNGKWAKTTYNGKTT